MPSFHQYLLGQSVISIYQRPEEVKITFSRNNPKLTLESIVLNSLYLDDHVMPTRWVQCRKGQLVLQEQKKKTMNPVSWSTEHMLCTNIFADLFTAHQHSNCTTKQILLVPEVFYISNSTVCNYASYGTYIHTLVDHQTHFMFSSKEENKPLQELKLGWQTAAILYVLTLIFASILIISMINFNTTFREKRNR